MKVSFENIDWENTPLRNLKKLRNELKKHPKYYGVKKQEIVLLQKWIKTKQNVHVVKVETKSTNAMIKFLQKVLPS